LVVQYRVPKELNTWIQRAGRAARDPKLNAMAVLIAEPSYFDDKKKRAAERAAARDARKRQAVGQLQLAASKRPGASTAGAQSRDDVEEELRPVLKCEKAMDDSINAGQRAEKCRRKVVNAHFGNNDLCKCLI